MINGLTLNNYLSLINCLAGSVGYNAYLYILSSRIRLEGKLRRRQSLPKLKDHFTLGT